MPSKNNKKIGLIKEEELYSSAITLSDMEIFIFPELQYSLLLANIMSQEIWKWRDKAWFKDIALLSPMKRVHRIKQYIMDNYQFNLDLETWGLTDKTTEIARFKDFIDISFLQKSNALFGYEGDKYYFDIDIRRHFGLDKYNTDIIPYWKTETIEAMNAFSFKENYRTGAGECVSLAALYAAALFIVGGISLNNIFMLATPLHSQNFILIKEGFITNNRRIVTKNMWVNGTVLSGKARRALENEKVTIVSHISGYIHTAYKEASIEPKIYNDFVNKLSSFLKFKLTSELLGSALRFYKDLHDCFQICTQLNGKTYYLPLGLAFKYEESSPYRLTNNTRDKILSSINMDDYYPEPIPGKIILNDLEEFLNKHPIDFSIEEEVNNFKFIIHSNCIDIERVTERLRTFCITHPKLPDISTKIIRKNKTLTIGNELSRNEIIDLLKKEYFSNLTVRLAFYAARDFSVANILPFIKASIERNPVSLLGIIRILEKNKKIIDKDKFTQNKIHINNYNQIKEKIEHQVLYLKQNRRVYEESNRIKKNIINNLRVYFDYVFAYIKSLNDKSIYQGSYRLATPDEVWNFNTGTGLEKIILFAAFIFHNTSVPIHIVSNNKQAILKCGKLLYTLESGKEIKINISIKQING